MTPLSQIILQQYRSRKSKQEKAAFLSFLCHEFSCQPTIGNNIMIGNMDTAKIILAARYDTTAKPSIFGSKDNTAGVIVLTELLATLNAAPQSKTIFLFYQKNMPYFNRSQEKLLIDLNCAPTGNHIMVSANKAARTQWGNLIKKAFLPTEQTSILFRNAEKNRLHPKHKDFCHTVAITTLKRKKLFGYYPQKIYSAKDTLFDRSNITLICNGILHLLKHI